MTVEKWRRFWCKVDRSAGAAACWPWTASKTLKGYGNFRMNSPRRMRLAHRVAYYLTHGRWPAVVRHDCDNPACCNPGHLKAGTHKDNTEDMDNRGRRPSRAGSKNHNSRLTETKVRQIRLMAAHGVSHVEIARTFRVARKTVSGIVRFERWRHV